MKYETVSSTDERKPKVIVQSMYDHALLFNPSLMHCSRLVDSLIIVTAIGCQQEA